MLMPIEAYWKAHRKSIRWDEAKGRFTTG